jgi:hypothetical protein
MGVNKLLNTLALVVGMTLVAALVIVAVTGSTDGLVDLGQMVATVVRAFVP